MAADTAMSAPGEAGRTPWRPSRLPPGGRPLGPAYVRAILRGTGDDDVAARLASRLGGVVRLHRSGRAALADAFRVLAARTGRHEIVVPAYTCYSVAAAAVAAGLRVRLVDVDPRGAIDPGALAAVPLDRAAAVVVSNLFGLPEPIADTRSFAASAGCAVVDDAAQAFGARDATGEAGSRGDVGILSFGRGKPLCALGGGAAVWTTADAPDAETSAPPSPAPGRRATVAARLVAYDVALLGPVFRVLAAIPALHIGETIFEPRFDTGAMEASARALLAVALDHVDRDARQRHATADALADRIAEATAWRPLQAPAGAVGVYPRLAVLAPSRAARDAALEALTRLGAGASRLYPESLDRVPAITPHRVGAEACPGARRIADHLLTLPTHGRLRGRRLEACLSILARCSR